MNGGFENGNLIVITILLLFIIFSIGIGYLILSL